MTVNGVPRWTCRTHVDRVAKGDRVEIGPLRNLPVIRDLVTDMSGFFDKWARARGQFEPTATRRDDFARVEPASAARRAIDVAVECIGCGICYAACDVVRWNPGEATPDPPEALANGEPLRVNADDGYDLAFWQRSVASSKDCYPAGGVDNTERPCLVFPQAMFFTPR